MRKRFYFPRVGWHALSPEIARDLARETGLDARRNLQAWSIRWLDWDVSFAVRETHWDEEVAEHIRTAERFIEALEERDRRFPPRPDPLPKPKKRKS
jgi:hypothetical protein